MAVPTSQSSLSDKGTAAPVGGDGEPLGTLVLEGAVLASVSPDDHEPRPTLPSRERHLKAHTGQIALQLATEAELAQTVIVGCQVWIWQIVIRKLIVAEPPVEPPVEPAPEPFDHSRIVAHASERREEPLPTGWR